MDEPPSVRLFVYGTLKRGFENAARLHLPGVEFEGIAVTSAGHALYDLGPYPALVAAPSGVVHGEVYRVSPSQLAELDEFEGCPELYQQDDVILDDGTVARAYVMAPDAVAGFRRIESGVWGSAG